jgi:branched-chain amino acid transport system substrate-binding protein
MVRVLKDCGNDLSRANIMKQAASLKNLKLPMLLPGVEISTGADDFAPIKAMQLAKFDGTTWKLFGKVISGGAGS